LHAHEVLLQQARAAEQSPGVVRKLRRRPIVERKIAHLKRHGMGRRAGSAGARLNSRLD
jgi:hypothetical protein